MNQFQAISDSIIKELETRLLIERIVDSNATVKDMVNAIYEAVALGVPRKRIIEALGIKN